MRCLKCYSKAFFLIYFLNFFSLEPHGRLKRPAVILSTSTNHCHHFKKSKLQKQIWTFWSPFVQIYAFLCLNSLQLDILSGKCFWILMHASFSDNMCKYLFIYLLQDHPLGLGCFIFLLSEVWSGCSCVISCTLFLFELSFFFFSLLHLWFGFKVARSPLCRLLQVSELKERKRKKCRQKLLRRIIQTCVVQRWFVLDRWTEV